MQGMALMRLARMVGLRQAELARYLGLAREQTQRLGARQAADSLGSCAHAHQACN